MKKFILLLCFTALIVGGLSAQIAQGKDAWVSSKTVALKSSTGFFASTRGNLALGDQVQVLQIKGNYAEVRSSVNSSLSGWVASSSLSSKKIIASRTNTASASEIALAGKGFNEEVEDAYKAQGNLDYADVDATESITVSAGDLYKFISEGHLTVPTE